MIFYDKKKLAGVVIGKIDKRASYESEKKQSEGERAAQKALNQHMIKGMTGGSHESSVSNSGNQEGGDK